MSDVRRPRGTMRKPVAVGWKIEADTRDLIASMARDSGVSATVFVEMMAEYTRSQLNEHGVPPWLPDKDRGEELPITPD